VEFVLLFVLPAIVAVVAVLLVTQKAPPGPIYFVVFAVSFLCAVIFVFTFSTIADRSWFEDGVEYKLREIFYSEDDNDTVLVSASPGNWLTNFDYLVDCDKIRGGCPDEWPQKFKVVKDGEMYVIVPLFGELPLALPSED
jgi:hypothetical protein